MKVYAEQLRSRAKRVRAANNGGTLSLASPCWETQNPLHFEKLGTIFFQSLRLVGRSAAIALKIAPIERA